MNLNRRLGTLLLCVLLAPLVRADGPAGAEATATALAKPKREIVDVPVSTLDSYVGRYELKPSEHLGGGIVTLFRDRRHFSVQFDEDDTYELFPVSPVRFFWKASAREFIIEKDAEGHVIGMSCEHMGEKQTGMKISNDPGLDGPQPADAANAASTQSLSPRLAALARELKSGDKGPLERFWQDLQDKAPLTEPIADDPKNSWVTFIWRGNDKTRRVTVSGGPPGPQWDGNALTLLPGTDLWYRTERIPNDARCAYSFQINWPETRLEDFTSQGKEPPVFLCRLDPLNPREAAVSSLKSLLEMPAAPPEPWRKRLPGVPAGTLAQKTIESTVLKERRKFTVFTPAAYDPKGTPLRMLVLFDGDAYFDDDAIPGHAILDNLIAKGKIPPVIAVFVNQEKRDKELNCSDSFADYVALELVPKLRKEYRVTEDPAEVIVGGLSLGGLMSSYCALRHPEVFGNVLSQSGAYQWPVCDTDRAARASEPGWLTREYVKAPLHPVRFYLEAGCFENFYLYSLLSENRRFHDVLQAKGYQVQYHEFSGGHECLSWRASFADAIVYLTH
jgi:enterochelin esterase-like enzyme